MGREILRRQGGEAGAQRLRLVQVRDDDADLRIRRGAGSEALDPAAAMRAEIRA
jgi:hypothetical protein